MGDWDYLCPQDFHTGYIGRLLGNVHFPHMDFTLHAKIGRCRCQRHPMLACPGFSNQPLLAHKFGKEPFPHAVVQFMGPCVV